MTNKSKTCSHCNAIYIGDGYKDACTKECYFRKEYEEKMKKSGRCGKNHEVKKKTIHNHFCRKCKMEFKSNRKNSVYCSLGCSIPRMSQEDRIKKANEKWLNPEEKKKSKWNFGQLNRMAEYKRVFDDQSWTQNYNRYRG